jgi:hypothetical protein
MRILLRDLSPGQDYAIQFRSNNGEAVSEWSQVQRFTTTDDVIPPSQVQNLSWYDSGSSFIGQWDKVTTQATTPPTPMQDFRYYRVNISDGTVGKDYFVVGERFDYSKEMNLSDFGQVKTQLTIRVYAVDMTYNESVVTTATANPLNPPTPSTPTVGAYLGLVYVQWDGKSAAGSAMPTNVMYAEVHVSTSNNFTPSDASFVGRVEVRGSATKMVVPGLTYNTQYYVKLIAVNDLLKKSPASAQATATPTRLSGLDIQNGQISPDQINFTARDIGGSNAYYSTSQPVVGVGGVTNLKSGDIWYDTDDKYTTYRYNGTTWVLAPEIGFIAGTKIVAGTLTSDAVGTNLLIASSANIADAIIDSAKISSLSASKIITGSIQANQRIIAGPELENHAEMTSTGFYVKGPQPGGAPGAVPIMIDRIRMGTGVSDFFAIPDPFDPESTLAQISEDGGASFQNLSVENDPYIMGKKLIGNPNVASYAGNGNTVGQALDPRWLNRYDPGTGGLISDRPFKMVGNAYNFVNGLEAPGSQGIREEYGIAQFRVPFIKNRTYLINWVPPAFYQTVPNGQYVLRLREQRDERTVAQQIAQPSAAAATQATRNSREVDVMIHSDFATGRINKPSYYSIWVSDYTGYSNIAITMEYQGAANENAVMKVIENAVTTTKVYDMGAADDQVTGQINNMGGQLYAYTTPPPPPPPATQQYYGEWRYNWVRSYKGNDSYMSNTDGRAYQGQDPSGSNGNQRSYFGFSHIDFAALTAGARIDQIIVYLYFAHWYYNAGGTARVGYTNVFGDPGGASRPGGIGETFDSGGWPKPGGRELNVTGWGGAMQSGNFRGIALGPGNNSYQNYGYATDCVIKLWYTK